MNKAPKRRPRRDYLKVMVTAEEKEKFRGLSSERHTDLSELIRQLLHREVEQSQAQVA